MDELNYLKKWLDRNIDEHTTAPIGEIDTKTLAEAIIKEGFSRRPEPLVRGMEIDVDAFAKDMFEVCHYPAPEYWKDQDENTKSRWRTNAEIIRDKAHVWLKEVGGE